VPNFRSEAYALDASPHANFECLEYFRVRTHGIASIAWMYVQILRISELLHRVHLMSGGLAPRSISESLNLILPFGRAAEQLLKGCATATRPPLEALTGWYSVNRYGPNVKGFAKWCKWSSTSTLRDF